MRATCWRARQLLISKQHQRMELIISSSKLAALAGQQDGTSHRMHTVTHL
jgi:hypothetical protein